MTLKGSFDAKRFWSLVDKSGECWRWTGYTTWNGYGMFGRRYGHRIAYEMLVGPISEGLTLDHMCRTRNCVNPVHLEPMTMRQNILLGTAPTSLNAAKFECKHGHPFTK